MSTPKLDTSSTGNPMHYSVGALIKQNNKYLLMDRVNPPFGFAASAGHIDENEIPEESLVREVKEETGLEVTKYKLVGEGEFLHEDEPCRHGIGIHYWYIFECEVTGELTKDTREAKSMDWYSADEIKKLTLEHVWKYWFGKLHII